MELADLVNQYGLPTVMAVGMGYFIFYVWKFVTRVLKPALGEMHMALIRVIDQTRMLDQHLIRLQQKVDVVLEYKENEQRRKSKQSSK